MYASHLGSNIESIVLQSIARDANQDRGNLSAMQENQLRILHKTPVNSADIRECLELFYNDPHHQAAYNTVALYVLGKGLEYSPLMSTDTNPKNPMSGKRIEGIIPHVEADGDQGEYDKKDEVEEKEEKKARKFIDGTKDHRKPGEIPIEERRKKRDAAARGGRKPSRGSKEENASMEQGKYEGGEGEEEEEGKEEDDIDDNADGLGFDPVFNHIFRTYYLPFVRKALAYWYAVGFVVWAKVEEMDPILKQVVKYPVVVCEQFYDILILTRDDHRIFYQINCKRGNYQDNIPDPNVDIFFMPGREPDQITGELRSVVANCLELADQRRQVESFFLQGLAQRAHPPIFLSLDDKQVHELKEPEMDTTYAESVLKLPGAQQLEKTITKMHGVSTNVVGAFTGGNSASMTGSGISNAGLITGGLQPSGVPDTAYFSRKRRRMMFVQTPADNVYKVEAGWQVSAKQPDLPEPQKDITKWKDYYRDIIFSQYQVPVALVYTVQNSKSGPGQTVHIDDTEQQKFNKTTEFIQNAIIDLCNLVYLHTHEKDVMDIEFKLNVIPCASNAVLMQLEASDYISRDVATRYLMSNAGLRIEDSMPIGKKNEHHRPPFGGNENQTGPAMKAKIENQQADTQLKLAQAKKAKAEAGDNPEGQMKVLDKEMELKQLEINGKKEIIQMQVETMRVKLEIEKQKLELDKERFKAEAQAFKERADAESKILNAQTNASIKETNAKTDASIKETKEKTRSEVAMAREQVKVNKSKPKPSATSGNSSDKQKKKKKKQKSSE